MTDNAPNSNVTFSKRIEKSTEKCYNDIAVNEADSLKGEQPMNRQEAKICALYERLSREDDDIQGESNSIQNQKQYLLDYAKNQGFTNIRHYTDDGTTGVRFQREAWQELMSDVENGKIATILTKDMSRVGREHVQVGMYLEIFRKADVRFIAVSNNIDSLYPETLEFAPFLNIMNEWYARDISRKIKIAKRSNGRNEKYTSSIAPYGYRKSETEKGKWEIDPEAAEIVKRIFRMTIEGYGVCSITNRLKKDKILSPGNYLKQLGEGIFKNREFSDPYCWQPVMIDIIIGRMEYKGCMVNLKTEKMSFKDKQSKKLSKEEWLVFEDKHEPIVDKETWQLANDIRRKKRKNKPDSLGEPHALSGLLYCADCKSKMYHNRGMNKATGKIKNYYSCKESKKGKEFCTDHRANGDVIEALILETLQRVSQYITTNEDDFTKEINKLFSTQQADTVKSQSKKLRTSQARYGELDKLIQRIYEDNVNGKINDKRFEVLSNQYEQEQAELEQTIVQLEADLNSFDDSQNRADKFMKMIGKYKNFTELTPTMIHEFIDRIEIHERADRRYKITTQKIDIFLNFIGSYQPPTAEIEKEAELRTDEEYEVYLQKLAYMREYRKRREANGGKPLGYFTGKKPDHRTPKQKEADEEAKRLRLKAYHAKWYQDNKERMNAERKAKQSAMSHEEREEYSKQRQEKRLEYEREYRNRNRAKINAYANEYRRNKRKQSKSQEQEVII